MREDEIITQIIQDAESATSSSVDVRLVGGDQLVSLPEVILRWNAERLPNANGHTTKAEITRDINDNATGIEHHTYYRMMIDFIVRFNDEIKKDKAANDLAMSFVPYEYDAGLFDTDTREWDIGNTRPTNNTALEPDWYESTVSLSFEYIKRMEQTDGVAEPIATINSDVEIDETLEGASSEVNMK